MLARNSLRKGTGIFSARTGNFSAPSGNRQTTTRKDSAIVVGMILKKLFDMPQKDS
jgi:hypothetical protein